MAILPMKQTITIKRAKTFDDWGNPSEIEEVTLKCRIEEGTQIKRYLGGTGNGTSSSENVVESARILIDKLADIRETDTIVFTNELGKTIVKSPNAINVKRGISGNPLYTEVVI